MKTNVREGGTLYRLLLLHQRARHHFVQLRVALRIGSDFQSDSRDRPRQWSEKGGEVELWKHRHVVSQ